MSLTDAKLFLTKLAARFKWARVVEFLLVAVGLGLICFGIFRMLIAGLAIPLMAGSFLAVVVFLLRLNRSGALKWNALNVASFLNVNFPSLRDSADLLASDRPVTGLETVQQEKVLAALGEIRDRVKVPHRISQATLILSVGLAALFLLPAAVERPGKPPIIAVENNTPPVPPSLDSIQLEIIPPAYTGWKKAVLKDPAAKVPVGSRVNWMVKFRGSPVTASIRLSAKDSLRLKFEEQFHRASLRANDRMIYQVTWTDDQGKRYTSDFYPIDVVEDLPPQVAIVGREQFQTFQPWDSMKVDVRMKAADEYGIRDAHLIATVSKGSGESVKFREVKLTFEGAQWPRKRADLTHRIDLKELGLEPGDELYFYAEAIDNRQPQPNIGRTETFFISIQDTSRVASVADMGLGVDLMPEYFRSQRQIIIDTEKLLAEQRRIKKQEFNSRSNELGFDQKTLRLKYGQFLGMEDEAGIGVVAGPFMEEPEKDDDDKQEDPSKKFGHEHDKENQHNLVDEKKPVTGHQHDEEKKEGEEEDPMKAFIHEHDGEEEATFLIQSVKAKLKAALSLMWDSELHLRMYEPKKSLPFQYRILALLKEIAQDNRVYVHRTGFDPPPIKEERRLTGDLDEVTQTSARTQTKKDNRFPAIQASLIDVEEQLQAGTSMLNDKSRALAEQAGFEVAAEALKQPGKYLSTLSTLRRMANGSLSPDKLQAALKVVRSDFWQILPEETWSPTRRRRTLHPLDRAVLEQLVKP